jgi:hypothetical protein
MKVKITLFLSVFMISMLAQAQIQKTMSVKDLESGIEKYIKKNYEGYKAVEAYQLEPVFEITIQKGNVMETLIFDHDGKFLKNKKDLDKSIVPIRTRVSMAAKDVSSDITKYVKKNFNDYTITEAFQYDLGYKVKIVKGSDAEYLLFDKDGKFEKKLAAPKTGEPAKGDTTAVKKEGEKKADTTKK